MDGGHDVRAVEVRIGVLALFCPRPLATQAESMDTYLVSFLSIGGW
jgi:hypothetical protein